MSGRRETVRPPRLPAPTFYTVEEAAHELGCARSTVYRFMDAGIIRSVKVGGLRRIPVDALAELARAR